MRSPPVRGHNRMTQDGSWERQQSERMKMRTMGTKQQGTRQRLSLSRQWDLIENFGQRDLKVRFKGSVLGWLWSLVVPLATLAIYSVVFSVLLRVPPPDLPGGRPGVFVLWLFCGLIFWTFFTGVVNNGIVETIAAGPILQKVYFPAYAPVMGAGLAVSIQSLIEVGLLMITLLFIGNVSWTWLLFPILAILVVAFTASLATCVAVLNIYYRDLAHLVTIALQLLFYATPIIYPLTMAPENWHGLPLQAIIAASPFHSFVELMRSIFYGLNPGSWTLWLTAVAWTAVALALATWVMHSKGQDMGENV